MSNVTIKVEDNGPYQVSGRVDVIDEEGNQFEVQQTISLCRCGHSDSKPFCDGTHEEIGFESSPRANRLMVEV